MSSFIVSLLWFLLFFGGAIFLAYQRINLFTSTIAAGAAVLAYSVYTFAGYGWWVWMLLSWIAIGVILAFSTVPVGLYLFYALTDLVFTGQLTVGDLGVIFAYFFRKSFVERAIIVASTIPIAILVNAFRVGLTGVLTHHLGSEAASGWIHQTEGLFTFGLAFFLLMAEAWILQQIWLLRTRAKRRREAT